MANSIQEEIIDLLIKNNLTIGVAESVTAGMISSYLASVPGCSKALKGGFIVYSNFAKMKVCRVKQETIEKFGAISKECVEQLALNTNKILNTDIAVAISGNAGPICDENKPVGFAYLCICVIDRTYVYEIQSNEKQRNDIRINLTQITYEKILKLLKEII